MAGEWFVYKRKKRAYVGCFPTRKEAVYWCKINQISAIPDGEWEDDYVLYEMVNGKLEHR
jgi:hypothetical protein